MLLFLSLDSPLSVAEISTAVAQTMLYNDKTIPIDWYYAEYST